MKFKKSLAMLMAGICLFGCSSTSSSGITVEPVMSNSGLEDIMPEETYKMMSGVYGTQFKNSASMLNYVGEDIKDIKLATKEGTLLTYEDLKDKKVVVEVVANWCEYCKTQTTDYLDEIYAGNEDIVFVQLFAEGNSAEIDAFYSETGKSIDADYVIPAEVDESVEVSLGLIEKEGSAPYQKNAISSLLTKIGVESYPSFVFFDEDGKLAWSNAGILMAGQFEMLAEVAYGETKIYETFKDGEIDFDALFRTADEVKESLNDEAEELIKTVETDENALTVLYSNLNRNWLDVEFTDINDESVVMSDLKGKKFIFEILTTDEENFSGSKTSAKNLKKFKDDGYTYIQFWLLADTETGADVETYFKENEIEKTADYIIALTEENDLAELGNIDLWTFPTQFFIDEDFKIAGATQGAMTKSKFESSTKAFFGKTPLYKMGKETKSDTED